MSSMKNHIKRSSRGRNDNRSIFSEFKRIADYKKFLTNNKLETNTERGDK